MDIQELCDSGKNMLDEVSNAVTSGNYSHLNDSLKEMTRRMQEQQERAARAREEQIRKMRGGTSNRGQDAAGEYRQPADEGFTAGKNQQTRDKRTVAGKNTADAAWSGKRTVPSGTGLFQPRRSPFLQKTVSRMTGLASQIVGFIVAIASAPFLIAALVLMSAFDNLFVGFLAVAIIMGALEALSIFAIVRGKKYRGLIRDYYRYGKAAGMREYIGVRDLAGLLGEEPVPVHLRLEQMMHKGLLPQARFDEAGTTLMLTDSVYDQYLKSLQGQQQAKEAEEQKKREWEEKARAAGTTVQAQRILREGEDYIAFVHKCNEAIPGKEMSEKLDKLEDITRRIFDKVRRDPAAAENLQKFMDYYLPMTRKLLKAYVELEQQPESIGNIQETRREIESAIDTINQAFEELFNSLFEDMAWDVSSDISAMRTMMAQDGLTNAGTDITGNNSTN